MMNFKHFKTNFSPHKKPTTKININLSSCIFTLKPGNCLRTEIGCDAKQFFYLCSFPLILAIQTCNSTPELRSSKKAKENETLDVPFQNGKQFYNKQ